MRIQVLFLLFLLPAPVLGKCLDPKAVIPLLATSVNKDSGAGSNGKVWGKVRGKVEKPLEKVLQLISDPAVIKSSEIDELEVQKISDPKYLTRQKVKYLVKPFLFVKVGWVEEWAFAVGEGTTIAPKTIIGSYEKVEGTSHIEHLCGAIILRKIDATSTDVYQYEEAKITDRNAKQTVEGLERILQILRTKT